MTADNNSDCQKRMRCLLSPYDGDKCCPGQTPHHLVEAGAFHDQGRGGMVTKDNAKRVAFVRSPFKLTEIIEVDIGKAKVKSNPVFGAGKYDEGAAPCICVEGESQNQGTHKLMHRAQGRLAAGAPEVPNPNYMQPLTTAKGAPARMQRLDVAIANGVAAVQEVFPEADCEADCVKAQLEDYHYKKAGMNPELPIKTVDGQGKAMPATR
jgi:GHH signature containing HNH/Endo VII superfamily nuclease toxin  2